VCLSTETVITVVTYPDSRNCDVWIVQTDRHSQYQLLGTLTGADPAIQNLIDRVMQAVIQGNTGRSMGSKGGTESCQVES
jgi:hypothetical protein